MYVIAQKEHRGHLFRLMGGGYSGELAYMVLAIRGLCAEIEFPSDWHEHRRGWVRLCLGFITLAFSFPWPWTVPDEGQCSGPRYGFSFFGDKLWLYFGKDTGRSRDPRRYLAISMPWEWRHRHHEELTGPETHSYRYTLRSGEVQERTATVKSERRVWTRWWFPWKRDERSIWVEFNDEVGERTGSWKGGVLGCGYDMKPGETPLATLRRMEQEREFT
jgi:hypothetical protein